MKVHISILVYLFITSTSARIRADDEIKNCKLTVRTFSRSGKKTITVEEIHADSRLACKDISKARQLHNPDPKNISRVIVSSTFTEVP